MSDEFSEAGIYPQDWGQAQFADPSRFTLTRWSVIGLFGHPDLAHTGLLPFMQLLAAQSYPPEQGVDLEATYDGDVTRGWQGQTHQVAWKQAEADPGGWLRFDRAFQITGDNSRGTAYAGAWVYSPTAVRVKLNVEPHGIVWAFRLWLNEKELERVPVPDRGAQQFRIKPDQEIALSAGWNRLLLRCDGWAHNWQFENIGGWAFRFALSGRERDLWGLRAEPTPPDRPTP